MVPGRVAQSFAAVARQYPNAAPLSWTGNHHMPRTVRTFFLFVSLSIAVTPLGLNAEQRAELVAVKVASAPTIDGVGDDSVWSRAKAFVTHDPLAKVDLTVKAVYTADSIYVLATFPDSTENRMHKTQVWVPDQDRYRIGVDREDTFVIKWNMEPAPVDLRVDADAPYKADIWFWKAHRTDPSGHADDKMHVYSALQTPGSKTVISKRGVRFYLTRPGDAGKAAYETLVHPTHIGDKAPLYRHVNPQGSRADVHAKGVWRNGMWTVEFARKLVTGNADDIQFDAGRTYQFGVSRFEVAGRKRNPKLEEPYFGAGEITEPATLRFN